MQANNRVGFKVAAYDHARPLVIDPVLVYSTYLGDEDTSSTGIAVDSSGEAYVTGSTSSTDFPTQNPVQANPPGQPNVFVTKFNASGSALGYSTYLGGSSVNYGQGIAVDPSGNAYVTGTTTSTDFPTMNPYQPTNNTGNETAFVAKLNAAGSALVYSTYLGGSYADQANAIAVDSADSAYVTGYTESHDFPIVNPYQANNNAVLIGDANAFVTKFNAAGSALVYSTYLGGSYNDHANAIAVDSAGYAYVTGITNSLDFPTVNPIQPNINSIQNAFVTKFTPAGSCLVYSTYLGGSGAEWVYGIATDPFGDAYVTGQTSSTDFPTMNPIEATNVGGVPMGYVTKFNSTGSALIYSTYLGGSDGEQGANDIAADSSGNAYVVGYTSSSEFPTVNPIESSIEGAGSTIWAFVTVVNPTGSALVYSTYLGGVGGYSVGTAIAVDSSGNAYITGYTPSGNFPTVNPYQPGFGDVGGDYSTVVAKISPANVSGISLTPPSLTFPSQPVETTSGAQMMTLTNVGSAALDISSVSTTGDFAQTNTCGAVIPTSLGSCSIYLTFTPTMSGPRTGTLTITDNAGGSPQSFNLMGTGSGPAAGVYPESLTFSSQNEGTTSAAQPVTLSNTGTTNLMITSIVPSANLGETDNCNGSVTANSSCTINVTFSPTATGPITGALTITDNANGMAGSQQMVSLNGTGTSPAGASVAPSSLSFGNQVITTTSVARKVTLTSNGTGNLIISGIAISGANAGDFSETNTCTAASYAPGAKCTISLTFTPSMTPPGAETATLTVTDNAATNQTVALTGTGEEPVTLSPTSLGFGNVGENSPSAPKTITVTNNQAVMLTISSITLSNSDYSETDNCVGTVAAKGKCTIMVTLTPTVLTADNGTLTVNDNASNSPQATLTGSGVVPAKLSATSLGFANVPQSTASTAKNITLTNNEAETLNITSIATGNPDFTETDTCDGSVAAKGNCVITVTFTPSIIGPETGTLTVTDAASNSPQTAGVTGTGTAQASVSPASLTFASQKVGTTSAAKTVTLTNNLSTALSISPFTFTGADPGDFTQTNTCGTSLAAKAHCTISVKFTPTATGTRTATLNVNDGALGSPQAVSLTGTGK